jgi:hypothetical protein
MARLVQTTGTLTRRLWRAAPWVLIGGLLLSLGIRGGSSLGRDVEVWERWTALLLAAAAPAAALLLDPLKRPRPGRAVTFAAYAVAVATAGHFANGLVLTRANSFYSAALLTEGALLLLLLHAAQALLRRYSPPPATASPRAADSFVDGVRVLLLLFFASTALGLRPLSGIALLLSLGFASIAVLLRTPSALAHLANRR